MAIHAGDAFQAGLLAHQHLVDRQHHFATNFEWTRDDQIERARYRAFSGVFYRHHSEIGAAGFHA